MILVFKKILPLTLMFAFSLGAYSQERLSLEDMRSEVLDNNIDIKVQYEKYYQAQRSVKNSLGEFLPNLTAQMFFWNTSYALLYAISPNPTSWFYYQASKELSLAEGYVSESIKLNILRDLTLSYISVKHQEELLDSMTEEEALLKRAVSMAETRLKMGLGSESDVFFHTRNLMKHQQQMYMLESAMAIQKEGIMMALNRSPEQKVELAELSDTTFEMPESTESAIEMGVERSPELAAHTFMTEGARFMVRGAKWSFLSFTGIGFGYPSALAIERSKVTEIELKKGKVQNKIENQIALSYEQMDLIEERLEIQKEIVQTAKENMEQSIELHHAGTVDFYEVVRTKRLYFEESRNLISLRMEKRMQLAKTQRLLGLDSSVNKFDVTPFENAALIVDVEKRSRRSKVSVNIDIAPELKDQIVSVIYGGDIFDYRILNTTGNFYLYTKVRGTGEKAVTASLLLSSGDIVKLETIVSL
ncbi:MAG: hypothetical protein CME64_18285 [Halobacteriovoraceae bacterium]|nr:hypothetical protein [Halobacteriovoraceae bacterium]|tara:strand:+ start:509 stop:1930 length:1422 start_codon:yes stop_codon:yes gene_type:complete